MPVSNANALAENRAAAKRQAVTTVSVVTLIFILWPERSNASGPSRRGARHPQNQATTFSDYVLMHLVDTASWTKSEAVRLWGIVGPVIGEWIHQALQLLISQIPASESSSSTWAEKPAPEFTQFYGILIKSPRGPRAPPPFASPFMMRDAPDRFVLRESKDATDLPSVLSAWDTDSRLSFCLIEKAIWDDRDLTLRNKLTTGTYWNISVQGRGYPRNAMDKAEVGRISAIEVIGLGDGQYDALKKSHKCHRLLNQDWKYTKMHWDDVDFAIILALLVLGPTAGTKCVQLYRALCKLRAEQVEGPRRGAPNIDPFLIAAATGGLAAPFVLPLMAGGLAAAVMKGRNGGMPEQRRKAYRGLMIQFPEVKVLFEEEEMAQKEESREKNMGENDDDDEWKDEGDDYYNDTLSPFDW